MIENTVPPCASHVWLGSLPLLQDENALSVFLLYEMKSNLLFMSFACFSVVLLVFLLLTFLNIFLQQGQTF
jgi:hypothetical protein